MALQMGTLLALAVGTVFVLTARAHELCTNTEGPAPADRALTFCPQYTALGCCSSERDASLAAAFTTLRLPKGACADVVQQLMCAECDPWSAHLLGTEEQHARPLPYLCNAASNYSTNFCDTVYKACADVAVSGTVLEQLYTQLAGSGSSGSATNAIGEPIVRTLSALWPNETDFCTATAPLAEETTYCYNGKPYEPPPVAAPPNTSETLCLERLGWRTYLNLVPHPDTRRAFLTTQDGYIYLLDIPPVGSGKTLEEDPKAVPWLDLSSRTVRKGELGLLGFALHPNFATNGRFFVSYTCDSLVHPDCAATCGCNANTNCTVADLNMDPKGNKGDEPVEAGCRNSSIVAEYRVNADGKANPKEVRRIFAMGQPYANHNGGQLLFGKDDYLYFMLGDGGKGGDPFNFAQNLRALLGKILRLDIDVDPATQPAPPPGVLKFGNYGIPADNPFVASPPLAQPEIYALGLRNPWRCSFDARQPTYFYCGDVGQNTVEEVDLIRKGGNYGWRLKEGPENFTSSWQPGGNTDYKSVYLIDPILSYLHPNGPASVTGGMVSYSAEDACFSGRYVYGDFYGRYWAAQESPKGSGRYVNGDVATQCAADVATTPCAAPDDKIGTAIWPYSFGQDLDLNFYVLGGPGLHRMVSPARCGKATCAAPGRSGGSKPPASPSPLAQPPPPPLPPPPLPCTAALCPPGAPDSLPASQPPPPLQPGAEPPSQITSLSPPASLGAAGSPPPSTLVQSPAPAPSPASSGEPAPSRSRVGRGAAVVMMVALGVVANELLGPQTAAVLVGLLALAFQSVLLKGQ